MAAQLPHPHVPTRASSSCERHPSQRVTGFCAACLRERLEGLDTANRRVGTSPVPSAASAALRSLLIRPAGPELRRCKSFSGRPPPARAPASEPQRRSCDVRGRSTLGSLFHLDDAEEEVNEEEEEVNEEEEETEEKELKETGGSFWVAASVFSKKLQKWGRKQKPKKQEASQKRDKSAFVFPFPSRGRRSAAAAEDGFGRRSCDTDPRCSMDDARCSWDGPRASWDGHLVGHRPLLPRQRPMLPLAEDLPDSPPAVQRLDGQIPVEDDEGDCLQPGGAAQTRDYYFRSGSQRRPGRTSVDGASLASAVRKSFSAEGDQPLPKAVLRSSSSSTEHDAGECAPGGNSGDSEAAKNGVSSKARRGWSKAWSLLGLLANAMARSGGGGSGGGAKSASARRERDFGGVPRRSCSSLSSAETMITKKRAVGGDLVLERSRSARLSPCRTSDGGVLKLYFGPTRPVSRKAGSGGAALQAVHPHSSAHNLALYLY